MGIGDARRLDDLLQGLAAQAVGDIVAHGVIEKDRLLGDDAHKTAQMADLDVTEVHPVQADHPRRGVVKARDEIDQGRFPRPARTDDGEDVSLGDGERKIVQHLPFPAVGKGDAAQFDRLPEFLHLDRPGLVLHCGLQIENRKDALRGRHRLLNAVVHARKFLHRLHQRKDDDEKTHELLGGEHTARQHLLPAEPEDPDGDHGAEKLGQGGSEIAGAGDAQQGLVITVRLGAEFADLEILHGEGLDHTLAGDGLLQQRGEIGHPLLGDRALLFQLEADPADDHHTDGGHHQGDEGQRPAQIDGDGQISDDEEGIFDQGDKTGRNPAVDQGDVIGDARDDLAGPGLGEIAQGEVVDLPVEIVADIADDPLLHGSHQIGLKIVEKTFEEDEQDDKDAEPAQGLPAAAAREPGQGDVLVMVKLAAERGDHFRRTAIRLHLIARLHSGCGSRPLHLHLYTLLPAENSPEKGDDRDQRSAAEEGEEKDADQRAEQTGPIGFEITQDAEIESHKRHHSGEGRSRRGRQNRSMI